MDAVNKIISKSENGTRVTSLKNRASPQNRWMTRRELVRGCYVVDKTFLSNTDNMLNVTAISIQFSISGLGWNFMKSFLSDITAYFSSSENVPFLQQQADACPSSISTQGFILFVSSVPV